MHIYRLRCVLITKYFQEYNNTIWLWIY